MRAQIALMICCFIGTVIGENVSDKYKYITGFIFGLISLTVLEVLK